MSDTRLKIINTAFDEIYRNGYHATSIDHILKKAGIGKSSMYYFFKSKKELVQSVIDIKVANYVEEKYGVLLELEKDFIDGILQVAQAREKFDFNCGCKLNNLVQELSFRDNDFKQSLEKIYFRFENIFEQVLDKAIECREIKHTNTQELSVYIVASIEGCISTAKKSQMDELYVSCISHLEKYLKSYTI